MHAAKRAALSVAYKKFTPVDRAYRIDVRLTQSDERTRTLEARLRSIDSSVLHATATAVFVAIPRIATSATASARL